MGVSGLLRAVKEIETPVNVGELKGQRLAVDGFAWLYRCAVRCAEEVVMKGNSYVYVSAFLEMVKMLRGAGCEVVVVLDGDDLPTKKRTNAERAERKEKSRKIAIEAKARGDEKTAAEHFARAVNVTPLMVRTLVVALRKHAVDYVVAPYEADAQLAYMAKQGEVDVVVTEDSDLLVYGAPKILYKLDRTGHGVVLETMRLRSLRVSSNGTRFDSLTPQQFVFVCVLAGCDFFAGAMGLGIKKAASLVAKYKHADRILHALRCKAHAYRLEKGFEVEFRHACLVFGFQRVYDRHTRTLVHLNPLHAAPPNLLTDEERDSPLEFLGPPMPDDVARRIAIGDLNPLTRERWVASAATSPAKQQLPQQLVHMPSRTFLRGSPTSEPEESARATMEDTEPIDVDARSEKNDTDSAAGVKKEQQPRRSRVSLQPASAFPKVQRDAGGVDRARSSQLSLRSFFHRTAGSTNAGNAAPRVCAGLSRSGAPSALRAKRAALGTKRSFSSCDAAAARTEMIKKQKPALSAAKTSAAVGLDDTLESMEHVEETPSRVSLPVRTGLEKDYLLNELDRFRSTYFKRGARTGTVAVSVKAKESPPKQRFAAAAVLEEGREKGGKSVARDVEVFVEETPPSSAEKKRTCRVEIDRQDTLHERFSLAARAIKAAAGAPARRGNSSLE